MKRFAIPALFWLGSACAAQAAVCTPLVTVNAQAQFDGRLLVPVTLEKHPLTLMLDTGSVATTLKWDLAKQLNLPVRQADRVLTGVGGVNGKLLNFTLSSENFNLGSLRLPNHPIYVEQRTLPGVDGTLSADIMRDYDVEVDFERHTLSFYAPDRCAGHDGKADVIAMEVLPSGHIRFPIKIGGTSLLATFDSGASTSILTRHGATALGIAPDSPQLTEQVTGTGNYKLYAYPFAPMEIGALKIQNPRIWIADDGFLPQKDSDIVLGVDALRHMRVIFGYGQNRLYITPAN